MWYENTITTCIYLPLKWKTKNNTKQWTEDKMFTNNSLTGHMSQLITA